MQIEQVPISVVVMTRNHENFIIDTIKSVYNQDYQGPIQLVIANDASTDSTHEVIQSFFKNNSVPPNFEIQYTNHAENKGMMKNFGWALSQATGKYTAFCEGDDYWTDPQKLSKQVAFLENHPDFTLVFSNTRILSDNQCIHADIDLYELEVSREFSPVEIFERWIIPFNTVMFRNPVDEKFFKRIYDNKSFIFGDIILFLSLAEKGRIFGMKDYTAVYRRHANNFTTDTSVLNNDEKKFHHLKAVIKEFGKPFETALIKTYLKNYAQRLSQRYHKEKKIIPFLKYRWWLKNYR